MGVEAGHLTRERRGRQLMLKERHKWTSRVAHREQARRGAARHGDEASKRLELEDRLSERVHSGALRAYTRSPAQPPFYSVHFSVLCDCISPKVHFKVHYTVKECW